MNTISRISFNASHRALQLHNFIDIWLYRFTTFLLYGFTDLPEACFGLASNSTNGNDRNVWVKNTQGRVQKIKNPDFYFRGKSWIWHRPARPNTSWECPHKGSNHPQPPTHHTTLRNSCVLVVVKPSTLETDKSTLLDIQFSENKGSYANVSQTDCYNCQSRLWVAKPKCSKQQQCPPSHSLWFS